MCPASAFAPRFFLQVKTIDHHRRIDGFGHVVERQAGDGGGRECFHFDACFSLCVDLCGYADRVVVDRCKVDFDFGEGEWVAEWDQVCGLFGTHDSCNSCDLKGIALRQLLFHQERACIGSHEDEGGGDRVTFGDGLVSNVNHPGSAVFIEVCECSLRGVCFQLWGQCLI